MYKYIAATRIKSTEISTELQNKPNVRRAVKIKPLNVIQKTKINNVGIPQYEHLYSTIINSTSKYNANEKPSGSSVNEKSSIKSELNEKVVNYRDIVNDKYTNSSVVHGKPINESSIESSVDKETASKESVVPKEAREFPSDVTIKSSLRKNKKSKQKKGKSVKRVRFTDDPERIPFWRRFVRIFHFLSNYTRNTVTTLKTAFSKYILLQYLPSPTLSLPIFEVCVWQLNLI